MPLPRHSRALALLALLLSAAPLVACGYGNADSHHDHYYPVPNPLCGDVIEEASIDTDQLLDVEPGDGAGVFIEYEAGGTYQVRTSCDSRDRSDCYWDILVTPLEGAPVLGVAPMDLESDDSVSVGAGNQVRMAVYTSGDFDAFTLQTDAGAGIELDALLDDACGNPYVFWVGDGALRSGAPSNPINLIPSAE